MRFLVHFLLLFNDAITRSSPGPELHAHVWSVTKWISFYAYGYCGRWSGHRGHGKEDETQGSHFDRNRPGG